MKVRPSPIAGTWYPGSANVLLQEIKGFLSRAEVEAPRGKIWGVVVPHAGYRYSGQVAAYAFKCLMGLQPQMVVVVSPFHAYHPGALITTACDAYQTPLGNVPVALDAVKELDRHVRERLGAGLVALAREGEHAVEIELPFLQHVLGSFHLLPVMMREQDVRVAQALGWALAEAFRGQDVLLVASSDLSHFYPQEMANKLDAVILRHIEAFDPQGVVEAEEKGTGFACGRGAIASVLWASHFLGADQARVVQYATSGDASGDYHSVVGYCAAVIWQAES